MSHRQQPSLDQGSPQLSLEEVKAMLEAQLDHQLGPAPWGCFPLLVALLGIALAVGLLVRG